MDLLSLGQGIKMKPGTSKTDILHTEGDWRISKFSYYKGSYLCIQHYCTAGRGGSHFKGWVGTYYNFRSLTEPCYVCELLPPPGLQGAFIMLIWDK